MKSSAAMKGDNRGSPSPNLKKFYYNGLLFLSFTTQALLIFQAEYIPMYYTDGVGSWHFDPIWATPGAKLLVLILLMLIQILLIVFRKELNRRALIVNYIVIAMMGLLTLTYYLKAPELFQLMIK
ncbi:MAG: hypothetical protein A2V67_14550 [Deltaproteobacteria bacterium RBG_13_61_14]|nr:MAG: hypothetical protein A2V67_14550 [Deltaproteobacteria bacterium RBG_13_61_14]